MNPFEMVVVIVFFSIVGGIISNAIKLGKIDSIKNLKDWDWDLDDLWDDLWDDDDGDDRFKKSQKKIVRQQQQLLNDVESKYQEKITSLEERIKVLETIVTDEKYQLNKEIEKLGSI